MFTWAKLYKNYKNNVNITSTYTNSKDYIKQSNRNIVENIYEGGHNVWECSLDMLNYVNNDLNNIYTVPDNVNILDLGCGKAIVSMDIYNKRKKINLPTTLFLQDLNSDVLKEHLQFISDNDITNIYLIADNWNNLANILEDNEYNLHTKELKFDFIFSCETLYRTSSFFDLTVIFYSLLKLNPNSKIYTAQKRYYFGLGGGTLSYMQYLNNKSSKKLKIEIKKAIEDGLSNVRDICEIILT